MWKIILFLLLTLLVVPVMAYYFDAPPTSEQWALLHRLFWIYVCAAGLTFIVSSLSRNYSQVDKLWSTIPILYAWVVAVKSGYEPRVVLMACLVSVWGIRLTYNFARRGGYSWRFWEGEEDYRWAILRAKPELKNPVRWFLFNLFFISGYQMGLILLFTIPIVKSVGGSPLGIVDFGLAALFVVLVILETTADQQQWNFQKEKYRRLSANEPLTPPYSDGFVRSGLWSWVRHPNYAAEQAIWIVFYLFTISAGGYWANWSVAGCVLLVLLFYGSSNFSEEISASKYPGYKEYQEKTGRFLPRLLTVPKDAEN